MRAIKHFSLLSFGTFIVVVMWKEGRPIRRFSGDGGVEACVLVTILRKENDTKILNVRKGGRITSQYNTNKKHPWRDKTRDSLCQLWIFIPSAVTDSDIERRLPPDFSTLDRFWSLSSIPKSPVLFYMIIPAHVVFPFLVYYFNGTVWLLRHFVCITSSTSPFKSYHSLLYDCYTFVVCLEIALV